MFFWWVYSLVKVCTFFIGGARAFAGCWLLRPNPSLKWDWLTASPITQYVRHQRLKALLCKPHGYCLAGHRFLVVVGVLVGFSLLILRFKLRFFVAGLASFAPYLLLSLVGFVMFVLCCCVCPNPSFKRDWLTARPLIQTLGWGDFYEFCKRFD